MSFALKDGAEVEVASSLDVAIALTFELPILTTYSGVFSTSVVKERDGQLSFGRNESENFRSFLVAVRF